MRTPPFFRHFNISLLKLNTNIAIWWITGHSSSRKLYLENFKGILYYSILIKIQTIAKWFFTKTNKIFKKNLILNRVFIYSSTISYVILVQNVSMDVHSNNSLQRLPSVHLEVQHTFLGQILLKTSQDLKNRLFLCTF